MLRNGILAAVAPLLALACTAPALPPRPAATQRAVVPEAASTAHAADEVARRFDFHVGFWVNLHQRLYAESGLSARSRPVADPMRAALPADQEAWDSAVAFYKQRYPDRGLMTLWMNEELMAVNRALSTAEDAPALASVASPAELRAALEAAAPAYRRNAWRDDEARGRAFRARVTALIERYGPALVPALERAYDTPWPSAPVRVDVAAYAGPVGAYTVTDPPHTTIASGDPRHAGDAALEILFHEASHALVKRVEDSLARAGRSQGKEVSPSLWHAVLFYSTGEVVRRALGPSYVPYALKNGLYDRDPAWRAAEPLLARYWPSYLDGAATLDATLDKLVAGLPVAASPDP